MKKINKKILLIVITIAVILAGLYFYYLKINTQERIPPAGPSVEEQKSIDEYYKKCPLQKLYFEARSDNFKTTNYKCSEDEQFKGQISTGEEAVVEIYTKDFEAGKQLFRDWLKSKGLVESPTLRITYGKPQ